MKLDLSFLQRGKPKNLRSEVRVSGSALTAFCWTGAAPQPLRLRDISGAGAFLETDFEWYVGTAFQIVLVLNWAPRASSQTSCGLWSRVVRSDSHGMGVEFIFADREEWLRFHQFLRQVAADGANGPGEKAMGGAV